MTNEAKTAITTLFWNFVILAFFGLAFLGLFYSYRCMSGYVLVKRSWLEESKKFKFEKNQYKCFRYAKQVSTISTLEIFEQQFDYMMIEDRTFVCKEILPQRIDYKPTESRRI